LLTICPTFIGPLQFYFIVFLGENLGFIQYLLPIQISLCSALTHQDLTTQSTPFQTEWERESWHTEN
jgi:hypothetical protein